MQVLKDKDRIKLDPKVRRYQPVTMRCDAESPEFRLLPPKTTVSKQYREGVAYLRELSPRAVRNVLELVCSFKSFEREAVDL